MWDLFKLQVKAVMESSPASSDDLAKVIATAYDNVVKLPPSGDLTNKASVLNGNVQLLENIIKIVFIQQSRSEVQLPIVNAIANGFVAYWGGARLQNLPIPIIPAPGSIQNIGVTNNMVINPGIQVSIPFTYEGLDNVDGFINKLIQAANIHLYTVGGMTFTTSVYGNGVTGPGYMPWQGFSVGGNPIDFSSFSPSAFETDPRVLAELKARFGGTIVDPTVLQSDAELEAQELIKQADAAKAASLAAGGGGGALQITYAGNQDSNLNEIATAATKFGINNPQLIIALQANALKETGGRVIVENVNYTKNSRERLTAIFGKRISKLSDAELAQIQSSPEAFANYIYGAPGNSLGNTQPGDGYKFRGRGFIQITGRANYAAASKALYGDDRLLKNPDLLNDPKAAAEASAWFINRSLDSFARKMNINKNDLTQEQATHLITSIVAGKPIDKNGTGFLTTTALGKANQYAAQLSLKNTNALAAVTKPSSGLSLGG